MAPRSKQPELRYARLSLEDMQAAIIKIDRRILEIDGFDASQISGHSDPYLNVLATKLDTLLLNIFGADTVLYDRYRHRVLGLNRASANFGYEVPISEIRDGYMKGLQDAKHQLQAIKDGFVEDIADIEDKYTKKPREADFSIPSLNQLHPAVVAKCRGLFEARHYSEAAEKSFKAVRDRLRDLTGYEKGSEAFGKGGLYIKGAAASNVDPDFNQAVKFLTMSIDMFRNEKSHTSSASIKDEKRGFHYLTLSSLAMYLLDEAVIKAQA